MKKRDTVKVYEHSAGERAEIAGVPEFRSGGSTFGAHMRYWKDREARWKMRALKAEAALESVRCIAEQIVGCDEYEH